MKRWKDRVLVAVGTCFGLGLCPGAPGTAGALVGVAIYWAIVALAPAAIQVWLIALALLGVCAVTVAMSPWAERHWQTEDSRHFVTDEVAGFLMTVLLWRTDHLLLTIVWAFGVTRVVDILKPPPCRRLERLPGGWGVLADDLFASLYAAAILHVAAWQLPGVFGRVFWAAG